MKLKSAYRSTVNNTTSTVGYILFHFLPVRTLAWLMVVSCLLLACKGPQLVSSTDNKTEIKKDSTVNSAVLKDSTIDRETVTEKTIPQAEVDFNLGNGARLDSIITVLKAMPKGVPQVITIPDKSHNAILQLFMDSLGRLAVRCTSSEKKYFEKVTQLEHYNSSLVNQLTQKNIELREAKTEVMQARKSLGARLEELFENIFIKIFVFLFLICIVVIIAEMMIKKVKSYMPTVSTLIKKIIP